MSELSRPVGRSMEWNRFDLGVAVGLLIGATSLFALTYGKLLDPIIDVGRDLYVPQAILGETKLYRDILYFYPPLTPYVLAGWVAVAGASLASYAAFGALLSLLCTSALFVAGRNLGSRHAGGAAAFLFLGWSFTGMSSWGCNFIFPYAHAATIGMTAAVCAIAALTHHLYVHSSRASLSLMVVAISIAGWSKVELALLSLAFMAVALFVYRIPRSAGIAYAALNLIALAFVASYFADAGAGHHWLWDNVLPESLLGSTVAKRFYASVSGFASWPQLLLRDLLAATVLGAEVLLLRWGSSRGDRGFTLALGLSVALAVLLSFAHFFFAAWAIVIPVLGFLALRERAQSPLLILFIVALGGMWRIYLRPEPVWYGFVLAIPLSLLACYLLFEWLPARGVYSRRFASLWWIVIVVVTIPSLVQQVAVAGSRAARIKTERGNFYVDRVGEAAAMNALVGYLSASSAEELVVIPEGLTINYFAGVATPLSHQTFTPIEADFPDVERSVLREIVERRPDRIAIVPRDTREFGYRGWGVDYHRAVAAHVRANYELERTFGDGDFPIVLLKRKSTVRERR